MINIIQGDDLAKEICDKLGLENVRRIVIDLPVDDVGKVYVEFLTDERFYNIDFKNGIEIVEQTKGDKYREYIPGKDGKVIDVTGFSK